MRRRQQKKDLITVYLAWKMGVEIEYQAPNHKDWGYHESYGDGTPYLETMYIHMLATGVFDSPQTKEHAYGMRFRIKPTK